MTRYAALFRSFLSQWWATFNVPPRCWGQPCHNHNSNEIAILMQFTAAAASIQNHWPLRRQQGQNSNQRTLQATGKPSLTLRGKMLSWLVIHRWVRVDVSCLALDLWQNYSDLSEINNMFKKQQNLCRSVIDIMKPKSTWHDDVFSRNIAVFDRWRYPRMKAVVFTWVAYLPGLYDAYWVTNVNLWMFSHANFYSRRGWNSNHCNLEVQTITPYAVLPAETPISLRAWSSIQLLENGVDADARAPQWQHIARFRSKHCAF